MEIFDKSKVAPAAGLLILVGGIIAVLWMGSTKNQASPDSSSTTPQSKPVASASSAPSVQPTVTTAHSAASNGGTTPAGATMPSLTQSPVVVLSNPSTATSLPSPASPAPGTATSAPPASTADQSDALASLRLHLAADTGINLVLIPAGTFLMGSPPEEVDRSPDEEPQTRVTLTHNFFLGATDVTQGQYEAVTGTNPSSFPAAGRDAPVESVSWVEAMAFCQKLNALEQAAGRMPEGYTFTLPTEAQWEYACRAGTTGPYAGDLDAMAWYNQNSADTTHPVGTKRPNAWGLYDMHGNVRQWCLDWYVDSLPGGAVTDPTGPASSNGRVQRGGCWNVDAQRCRSAYRRGGGPNAHDEKVGFRVALSVVR